MAKAKAQNVVQSRSTAVQRQQRQMPGKQSSDVMVEPVDFVEPTIIQTTNIEAPPGWEDAEEQDSGLNPVANWQVPGQYVEGTFIKVTEQVGPNKSRLYTLSLADGQLVGVWGNTVLDDRMDKLTPSKGDGILIQFLGTTRTARGLSEAKLFRVRVVRQAR